MTIRSSPFGARAFTLAEGRASGIGTGALDGPGFDRPFRGIRQWRPDAPAPAPHPTAALRRLCEQYRPRLRPGQFYCSETALVMAGAPAPRGWRPVVHVAAHRPSMPPRTVGVVGHRLQSRAPALWRVADLPIEHPARAWVRASVLWARDDLIAAADFLVSRRRPLVTLDDLRAEARWARRQALDDVLAEVRDGAESHAETRLRLAIVRAGLPEPVLNSDLRHADGSFVARLDGAYPQYRVGVEYDGRGHAFDVAQFERDADRWDAIREEGWTLVRVLDHHLRDSGRVAVEKVRRALTAAGWSPGS